MKADKETKQREFKRFASSINARMTDKDGINYNKLLLILKMSSMYSFEEIKKLELFPARSWYRYTRKLKDFGITKASFSESMIPEDRMNFQAYNSWMFANIGKLHIRNPHF